LDYVRDRGLFIKIPFPLKADCCVFFLSRKMPMNRLHNNRILVYQLVEKACNLSMKDVRSQNHTNRALKKIEPEKKIKTSKLGLNVLRRDI